MNETIKRIRAIISRVIMRTPTNENHCYSIITLIRIPIRWFKQGFSMLCCSRMGTNAHKISLSLVLYSRLLVNQVSSSKWLPA